ncbi:IclR family transcriptional regulator [Stappia sp.]|jgi:DNA-binding IclR family transcriptional regulator|uniref:IclR family transcriptional regulator n=1 Tax=Stappia sp. TaxID=1870903 RepID=UPI003A98FB7C
MSAQKPAKPQRGVQTVETAGAILRAFARNVRPMKLRELSDATGIAPSQLHPYLVSLRNTDMVEQIEGALYTLGPFALELGLARLRGQDAYPETIRRIGELSEATELMVAISVWGAHGTTIVYVRDSPKLIHSYVRPGNIFQLSLTATGRLFAAFLPAARTDEMIRAEFAALDRSQSAHYRIDEPWFRARLETIRAQGFETTVDIPIPGVSAVAAPVFDHTGTLQLGVTLIGPSPTIDLRPEGSAIPQLTAFTAKLSADLGYFPQD